MKNRKRFVSIFAGVMAAIMVLTLLLSLLPTRASAAASSEIRKQINELRDEKKDIQKQIDELKEQYEENEDEIASIVNRKNLIDQEIALLMEQIDNINEQISAFSVLVADKQDELDNAQSRLDTLNDEFRGRIRTMEEDGSLTYWEVLFHANSFSDLLDRLSMVEEIAASDTHHLEELGQAAENVEQSRAELAAEKADMEETRKELDDTMEELDDKRKEADELIKELLDKGEELQALWEEKEEQDKALLDEIAAMEKAYNEAKRQEYLDWLATATTAAPSETAGENNGSNGSSDNNSGDIDFSGGNNGSSGSNDNNNNNNNNNGGSGGGSSATWRVPVNYTKISSPFGYREQPTAGASTYHQGVDLAAPANTHIYASRSGTVTAASKSGSLGFYVTINHGDGFSSLYAHMTRYCVSAGQTVSAGDTIGYVGSTGISTGNHLHFGIMLNGSYVNPAAYVPLY